MRLSIILVAVLSWGAAPSSAGRRARLALSKKSGVEAKWLVPPRKGKKRPAGRLRFTVDGAGRPIVGTDDRWVAGPVKGMAWKLARAFHDMAAMRGNGLVFCTKEYLGLIPKVRKFRRDKRGAPTLPLQPIVDVPVRDCRLFSSGDDLYILGRARDSKRHQVYRLRLAHPGRAKKRPALELLYSSEQPISAVAGNGDTTYMATGGLIVELRKGRKPAGFFFHPSEEISGLAYSKGAGLFYATRSGVGFAGPKARLKFLNAKRTQIAARKGALYVFFEDTLGVLKIEGLKGFGRLRGRAK